MQTLPLYTPLNYNHPYISLCEAKTGYFIERPVFFNPIKMSQKKFDDKFFRDEFPQPTFVEVLDKIFLVENDIILHYKNDADFDIVFGLFILREELAKYREGKEVLIHRSSYLYIKLNRNIYSTRRICDYFLNPFTNISNLSLIENTKQELLECIV